MVGEFFPDGPLLGEFFLAVFRNSVLPGDAFHHLPIKLGEFAMFLLEQLLHIDHPVARQLVTADLCFLRQVGKIGADHRSEPVHACGIFAR